MKMTIELKYLVEDESTRQRIIEAVQSAARLLDQADELKGQVTDSAKFLKEEIDLDTKDFNELVKFFRKDTLSDTIERYTAMDAILSNSEGSEEY
jgi:hypothetical protein